MVAGRLFWRNISHDEPYKAVDPRLYTTGSPRNMRGCARPLIGLGVMPITNANDAIAEMERCKNSG